MSYFDNAATTGKKPPAVTAAVIKALRDYSANPGRSGHKASAEAAEAVYRVREAASEMFGASGPERVIFTPSCTYALNCVLKGILHPGDHAVVSSLEHNAVMRPLVKTGAPYSAFTVLPETERTLEAFKKALRPNTRLCVCTAASNVTGQLLPIEKIGEICKGRGIAFCVDAAQAAGVIPISMRKMHIDYLCIAPHKGLYAPMGTGILICEAELTETLTEGGTGTNSIEMRQPSVLPERHESGTLNLPGILGIGAGIDFVKKIGIEKIYAHEMHLITLLYEGLAANPHTVLYTQRPDSGFAPVLPFNFAGVESGAAAARLSESGIAVRGGLHCAPTAHRQLGTLPRGTVRLSTGVFNTVNEVNAFLRFAASEKFIKNLKNVTVQ